MNDSTPLQNINSLSFSVPLKELKNLPLNKIIHLNVLDILPDKTIVLFHDGISFYANSKIPLKKGDLLLAKVLENEPKLVLQLLETKLQTNNINHHQLQLTKMNILPSPLTTSAAEAFSKEGIPLTVKSLSSFLDEIKSLKNLSPKELHIAAKAFKLDLPITKSNIDFLNETLESNFEGNLKNFISLIQKAISEIPASEKNKVQESIQRLESLLSKLTINEHSEPENITKTIRDAASASPLTLDKKLFSEISAAMLNQPGFLKKLPQISYLLNDILVKTPDTQDFAPIIEKATEVNILVQDGIKNLMPLLDKTSFQVLPDMFEKTDFSKRMLLDIVQNLDEFWRLIQKLDFPHSDKISKPLEHITQQMIKVRDLLLRSFSELIPSFENETISFKDVYSPMDNTFKREIPFLKAIFNNLPENIKAEIFNLSQEKKNFSFESEIETETDEKGKKNLKMIHEAAKQFLNKIVKEQITCLQATPQKEPPITFYFTDQLELKELNLEIKSAPSKGKSSDRRSYFIYFKMNLSNLGQLEISIMDHPDRLEVFFFSSSSSIQDLITKHFPDLETAIKKYCSKPLKVNSFNQKEDSGNKNKETTYSFHNGNIDIVI